MAFGKRMSRPLRGVNLGGWLVLEPWMTPSLFTGTNAVDEYTFCEQGDLQKLRAFRDTFITEADFAWLAKQGIEAVRLPVGYWLFGDCEPYDKTVHYVDNAFAWAAKHGIKVLLSLHGLPGSQNGKMHSGKQGDIAWPQHMDKTYKLLGKIGERYGTHEGLLGVSLINEPSPTIPRAFMEDFYAQSYALLRKQCRLDTWIIFSDTFKPRRWRWRLPTKQYPGLYIDHHQYQIYMRLDKILPIRWQVWRAKHVLPRKLRRIARKHPLVIGEWSMALRYSQAVKVPEAERRQLAHEYAATQLAAFSSADAWFYWSYKTEDGGSWSYRDCVEKGRLPDVA
jgi:glucan 1,3-beta-glucosidase